MLFFIFLIKLKFKKIMVEKLNSLEEFRLQIQGKKKII